MQALKVTAFDGSSIITTDPLNVNNTFRQKHSIARKNASDGSPLTNIRNEFTLNKVVDVPAIVTGARQPTENLSVKLVLSASTSNASALEIALDDAYFNAKRAIKAGALNGFILQPTDAANQFVFDSAVV